AVERRRRDAVAAKEEQPPLLRTRKRPPCEIDRLERGGGLRRDGEAACDERIVLHLVAERRGLQAREGAELAHVRAAGRRRAPEDEVVDRRARCGGAPRNEPAGADADRDEAGPPRLRAKPRSCACRRIRPPVDERGVAGRPGAVAAPRIVEAKRRPPRRREVLAPVAAGAIRADVVPAERRAEQHRR